MNYYVLSKLCYLIATLLMFALLLSTYTKRQRQIHKRIEIRETQIMKESEEKH